ncbi:MAG TPA: hypothetical protein VMD59_22950, partial [Acidimicrobiales bacterium]|nr:hypothetical protein [Acidimicrobiales bacterium]
MASFEQPTKQISQTLIWTALPQGPGPSTGTMRISVLVSPQLSFDEVVGYRAEQSTTLQSFPDFLNWPQTVSNPSSPISFEVVFGLPGGASARVRAEANLSVLRADCWAAMFSPATTRVDSYGFTDWSQKSQNTFDVAEAHSDVVGLYNDYSGNSAYVNATASADATSYQDPSQLDLPSVAAPGQLKSSSVPANGAAYGVLAPTPAVQGALDF